jgi:hypothetical protein
VVLIALRESVANVHLFVNSKKGVHEGGVSPSHFQPLYQYTQAVDIFINTVNSPIIFAENLHVCSR